MKTTKRLAIIGGQGPVTSAKFCIGINERFRDATGCQPDIMLANMPISKESEQRMIAGEKDIETFELMTLAVERLTAAGTDFIVIPCNTAHVFIDQLRSISSKPIISIVEECAKECKTRGVRKVGLLASMQTIQEKLHEKALVAEGVGVVIPENQKEIDHVIMNILNHITTEKDKQLLVGSIAKLKEKGAEAVILACTDFSLLLSEEDLCVPLIDSLTVLENVTVEKLCAY
jgi:aspartate racemase